MRSTGRIAVLLAMLAGPAVAGLPREPFSASEGAVALDRQMDWRSASLLVVQADRRYKTLDSFAREAMAEMTGREHLPGLSPMASLLDWLFNRAAYDDVPLIRIRDKGLRIHLTEKLPEAARQRIRSGGYITPSELRDPRVQERIEELEPRFEMNRAIARVRGAEEVARFTDELLRIVPRPGAPRDSLWFTVKELRTSAQLALPDGERPPLDQLVRDFGPPAADVRPDDAAVVVGTWNQLAQAWQARDANRVQAGLNRLAEVLPSLAAAGVYPGVGQRQAEKRYYENFIGSSIFAKASLGWLLYLTGALVSVVALVTRWRTPYVVGLLLLAAALSWHAYALALRWYIVGRIPVANMFEAITASAWIGIALALVAELFYRTRVFLLAAHATGFVALVTASYVLPMMGSDGGQITEVMGILDDIMLRIHTVLIIASYALIFLAAVIAVVYLFGYHFHADAGRSASVGLTAGLCGALLAGSCWLAFRETGATASGIVVSGPVRLFAVGLAVAAAAAIPLLVRLRLGGVGVAAAVLVVMACLGPISGSYGFSRALATALLAGGLVWAGLNLGGMALRYARGRSPQPALALAGGGGAISRLDRPVLAGAAPGDEGVGLRLPAWLQHTDWSHLIILNLAFWMLFVGIILGAVWADYSWGRPWGWDPKETFALNTWIIYAILIHSRFVAHHKGLWTAWLSVAGCAMMAFNWFVVNFYIVGLHSYA